MSTLENGGILVVLLDKVSVEYGYECRRAALDSVFAESSRSVDLFTRGKVIGDVREDDYTWA